MLKEMKFLVFVLAAAAWMIGAPVLAADGASVVVVYNSSLPESRSVAEYYAEKRGVPSEQVIGYEMPATEDISRTDFNTKLKEPLLRDLESKGLLTFSGETKKISGASIRYAVLCYGTPVRILEDAGVKEPEAKEMRSELRRNEAAVDGELAILPQREWRLTGPAPSPFYGMTNASVMHPTNGLLMVTRLDGPSAEIAKGLVDKAMEAEKSGLWGRAYIDSRGITEGPYVVGDDWMRGSAGLLEGLGFEVAHDQAPDTFAAALPVSDIALYAGWYDANVSGPFALEKVDFSPGAVAYHLHSFSARSIRTPVQHWVGPLLAKGAAATMGAVNEPYLEGTPDIQTFFSRLVYFGFSFAEAAYASQRVLSWQVTVVGDPLYRPFARDPKSLHEHLIASKDRRVEWSVLRWANLMLANGQPESTVRDHLKAAAQELKSPVLWEKLGDQLAKFARFPSATEAYNSALQSEPSAEQRLRILLSLARAHSMWDEKAKALEAYDKILADFPNYSGKSSIQEKRDKLAKEVEKSE